MLSQQSADINLSRQVFELQSTNIALTRKVIGDFTQQTLDINLVRQIVLQQYAEIVLRQHYLYDDITYLYLHRIIEIIQSANIDLIRQVSEGLNDQETSINLIRNVVIDDSANIKLIRQISIDLLSMIVDFSLIGSVGSSGIVFDYDTCVLIKENKVIAYVNEVGDERIIKPKTFVMFKPDNINNSLSYDNVSDYISSLLYKSSPLFPDRSNKGYNR